MRRPFHFRVLAVDLGVWAVLVVLFVATLLLVGYLNRPPTLAEQQARAEQTMLSSCRGWAATKALHIDMQDGVCGCIAAKAATSFGGIDDSDFAACRQRVAAGMTRHPGLENAFAANFPALCGALEGRIAGLASDGSSAFCQCYGVTAAKEPLVKAAYAFGGGEVRSADRDNRLGQCTDMLAYGEGWQATGPARAVMHMPPYLPYRDLVLRCAENGARFEVLSGDTPVAGGVAFYDDDGTSFDLASKNGVVDAPASYGLIGKLAARRYVTLQTDGSSASITLQGFVEAARAVVQKCPESEPATPAVAADTKGYPDSWEAPDEGFALLYASDDRNWAGSLVCGEAPTYLTLQGPVVEDVIARNPNPTGDHLASDISVTLAGEGGTLFEARVPCDWGANEGDTDSCFVTLDKPRLDRLYASGFLAVTIDGEALDPVAFGASRAVQAARQACYRNTRPLN